MIIIYFFCTVFRKNIVEITIDYSAVDNKTLTVLHPFAIGKLEATNRTLQFATKLFQSQEELTFGVVADHGSYFETNVKLKKVKG